MGARIKLGGGWSIGGSGPRWSGRHVSIGASGTKLYGKGGSVWIPNKSRRSKARRSNVAMSGGNGFQGMGAFLLVASVLVGVFWIGGAFNNDSDSYVNDSLCSLYPDECVDGQWVEHHWENGNRVAGPVGTTKSGSGVRREDQVPADTSNYSGYYYCKDHQEDKICDLSAWEK